MCKRIGRAPSDWVYKFLDLRFESEYVSRSEICERLGISVDTLRKKVKRLDSNIFEYEITLNSGQKSVAYDVDHLRELFLSHIQDWDF